MIADAPPRLRLPPVAPSHFLWWFLRFFLVGCLLAPSQVHRLHSTAEGKRKRWSHLSHLGKHAASPTGCCGAIRCLQATCPVQFLRSGGEGEGGGGRRWLAVVEGGAGFGGYSVFRVGRARTSSACPRWCSDCEAQSRIVALSSFLLLTHGFTAKRMSPTKNFHAALRASCLRYRYTSPQLRGEGGWWWSCGGDGDDGRSGGRGS